MNDASKECLPCAPGGENINQVLSGNGEAAAKELLFFAERAVLVGLGLFVVGFRGDRLVRGTVSGALAVETLVFGYILFQRSRSRI